MLGLATRVLPSTRRCTAALRPRRAYTKDAWSPESVDLNSTVMPFSGQAPNKLKNMLFLHGLFGSGTNWRSIASHVQAQTLVNAHLLDARNHGLSPHTEQMSYELMAEDIFRYIVKNDLGRCTMLGHSMGGRAAMHFATKYPELVEKLIVVDIAPVAYGPKHYAWHYGLMRDLLKMDLDAIKSRREAEKAALAFISDPIVRGFLLQNLVGDPERPERYRWRINLQGLYRSFDSWIDAAPTPRFSGPTMFIAGGASPYIKPQDEGRIRELFPQAQIASIPDGTHYVHYEKPAEVVQTIVPFMARR